MKNLSFRAVFQYYLGIIAMVFSFQPRLIAVGIIGLLILVITGYRKKEMVFQWSKPLIFLALFYVVYLVGICFTTHPQIAGKYAEYKLSLLVFPLLLSFRFRQGFNLAPVVTGLIAGLLVSSFMSLFHSYGIYRETGDFNNSFGSSAFSYIHHPSYFSAFFAVALAAVWYGYFQRWNGYRIIPVLAFSLYAVVMQVFCFSAAGLLFLMLLGFTVFLVWICKRFGKLVFAICLVILPSVPVIIYNFHTNIRITVDGMISAVSEYAGDPSGFVKNKKEGVTGNDVRLIMWTVSAEEFAAHPFGVGTGNMDDHLSERLAAYGQLEMAKKDENQSIRYNPHNQFLQTGLETGIIGLLVFLLIIVSGIAFACKNSNWILMVVVCNLAFNSLFESMLQRESGIVFYTFWICVLVLYSNSRPKSVQTRSAKLPV